jgi:hypothetical protein
MAPRKSCWSFPNERPTAGDPTEDGPTGGDPSAGEHVSRVIVHARETRKPFQWSRHTEP